MGYWKLNLGQSYALANALLFGPHNKDFNVHYSYNFHSLYIIL